MLNKKNLFWIIVTVLLLQFWYNISHSEIYPSIMMPGFKNGIYEMDSINYKKTAVLINNKVMMTKKELFFDMDETIRNKNKTLENVQNLDQSERNELKEWMYERVSQLYREKIYSIYVVQDQYTISNNKKFNLKTTYKHEFKY